MDRCTVSFRFFGAILCCTPSANSTLHRPDNSSNEINVTNSPLCVQWFTNPQTSAIAPMCNTVISSAVKINTMNNICNDKYWGITHQVLTAHCSSSTAPESSSATRALLDGGSETQSSESEPDGSRAISLACLRWAARA